jgi:hypothetical protein
MVLNEKFEKINFIKNFLFKAAIESLLSGAICGILYHLFAGQPLTILGSTGPVLVFETIVHIYCTYEINLVIFFQ